MIFSNPGFSGTTHLQQETAQFIPPDRWPANSPNLNPVDYCVWGLMQEGVYKTPVRDISDLKQRVIDTWGSTPQSIIDKAIDHWTARLREGEWASL